MTKVLIGMSGGVDSSVAALLLKRDNYEVIGATINLIDDNISLDAKKVCDKLNIEFNIIDLKKEFENCVINYFINEYKNCKTPNPCIECNKNIKFKELYEYAKNNNIDYIATGHYAKIEYSEKYERYVLKKANNILKDQSYFLYCIPKELLSKVLFPLGAYNSKDEIRKLARDCDLPTASKSDSQDICFINDGNYKDFLQRFGSVNNITGDIIYNLKKIGVHTGLYKYTIGQRKGLGISHETPLYVIGFNKLKNELIVGDEKDLYVNSFKVKNYNLLLVDNIKFETKVTVKTRYKSKEFKAIISLDDDNMIFVKPDIPQKGVTGGQSAVFYIDDVVYGGGIIV